MLLFVQNVPKKPTYLTKNANLSALKGTLVKIKIKNVKNVAKNVLYV